MTDRLTPERETEIAARAEAATPGPWTVALEQCDCRDGLCSHGTYVSSIYSGGVLRTEFGDFPNEDWRFTIHAREDVPALLAELNAVRAEREQAREVALREAADHFDRTADFEPDGYRARVMRGAANDIRRLITAERGESR